MEQKQTPQGFIVIAIFLESRMWNSREKVGITTIGVFYSCCKRDFFKYSFKDSYLRK